MKKTWILLGFSLFLFLICPLLTVLFDGMAGMAICLIQFFVVNPLFFIVEGLTCGLSLKQHWWLPPVSVIGYLIFSWVLFDFVETAFVTSAGLYLVAGVLAMFGAHFGKKLQNHHEL